MVEPSLLITIEFGIYGSFTGVPITEVVKSTGTRYWDWVLAIYSTVLYIASTQSQYLVPVDFTTSVIGTPVKLPYIPNSMVISNDGSTIYMGTSTEIMVFSALTSGITREDPTISGTVLAVSPD